MQTAFPSTFSKVWYKVFILCWKWQVILKEQHLVQNGQFNTALLLLDTDDKIFQKEKYTSSS